MRCNYFLLGLVATALAHPTVKPADTGKRVPTLYEGKGANFDYRPKENEKRKDDGSWQPGKYEGDCTGYDDGKWNPEKQG
ncbi:uncharacterized protein FPRO_15012 [Fusarium proliferatum ET1]|uniref:Uncharacterized protein n=2 Tax=Gibberella intermedia TaxID=948311 RepID=A0A1L7W076_FUSPR|nr:uncharacterized protein FPRO_15012 [Fusarium proliferatum ET1]RBA15681.1 hypothetical protein FPRO05_12288 [Fusarium proliferatum]CZR45812.1 uncharacterized protein FPRO_15012 [Fusarium proliferatum ET1]